jgi:hypothetical protein
MPWANSDFTVMPRYWADDLGAVDRIGGGAATGR